MPPSPTTPQMIASAALAHIGELSAAMITVFLTEATVGTSTYRSVHSLTQQVEHQYHGRFLIELIQNAHDVLDREPEASHRNRIEILFDPEDSPHGSLFVANDGEPFTQSNFDRLSQLGQSDKDPQKDIGNKGIGFRSVLEISERPEIHSRSYRGSAGFDGFSFGFRPEVIQSLVEPLVQMAEGGAIPVSPISGGPLVDWGQDQLEKFRARVRSHERGWLQGEIQFLSPYLLPVPLGEDAHPRVREFAARGFATVVRLPLKNQGLAQYVLDHMALLTPNTLLFLDRVHELSLIGGPVDRVFTRAAMASGEKHDGRRVNITDETGFGLDYLVWTRELLVKEAPVAFRDAVSKLPGRWPEIQSVAVSVAVRTGPVPEAGSFSIFLPTQEHTGSAVHVNAPFFGDMSRTTISLANPYNQHLLWAANDLSLEVINGSLAGGDEEAGQAILDLLAPFGPRSEARERWCKGIQMAADRRGFNLDESPWMLAERGWRALNGTYLVPDNPKTTVLTAETLRAHATFDSFHANLDSRRAQIQSLAESRGNGKGAEPPQDELAATLAEVAASLQKKGGDWNSFWRDVKMLMPSGQKELAKHPLLLGTDGNLHRAETCTVFFGPRQGAMEEDGQPVEALLGVPASLQPYIAFLSDSIQMFDPARIRVHNPVWTYLGEGLVSPFTMDGIFGGVLRKLSPPPSSAIEGEHFERCKDMLGWALRLMSGAKGGGLRLESGAKLLGCILVPCLGGWFPMQDASFGAGWPDSVGDLLTTYLAALPPTSANEARERLLLPPEHAAWGGLAFDNKHLLLEGGVADWLRITPVTSSDWNNRALAKERWLWLPKVAPPGIPTKLWQGYRQAVLHEPESRFVNEQTYLVGDIFLFPGVDRAALLPHPARTALCELILRSLPRWKAQLSTQSATKSEGYTDVLRFTPFLKYYLRTTPWLVVEDGRDSNLSIPSDHWYVPADALAGHVRHFTHLQALPQAMAERLDGNGLLAAALGDLGMPKFDLHHPSPDPRLLQALAGAVESEAPIDPKILRGQIREAWDCFQPAPEQPALERLIVSRGASQLEVVVPSPEKPAYLPDSGAFVAELEQLGLPVLTLRPPAARGLKPWFETAYGMGVLCTSSLRLVPHVSGVPWSGMGGVPLAESELGWLLRPLLIMVISVGQTRGIYSPAFKEASKLLNGMKVLWAPEVSRALMWDQEQLLPPRSTPALWDHEHRTMLVSESCRNSPDGLGQALAQALNRNDLEVHLRWVLSKHGNLDQGPEDLISFLAPLNIHPDQVAEVVEHLQADIGHAARLIQVLVAVLAPDQEMSSIPTIATEEALLEVLEPVCPESMPPHWILEQALASKDHWQFGRVLGREMTSLFTLPAWNNAMKALGLPVLSNQDWRNQFLAGLEEAAGAVKRIIASLIQAGHLDNFQAYWRTYEALPGEVDLGDLHWEVSFKTTLSFVGPLVAAWPGGEHLSGVIISCSSLDSLREHLATLGVPPDLDPDECYRENSQLVQHLSYRLETVRLAWIMKTSDAKVQGDWRGHVDLYQAAAQMALGGNGYTHFWALEEAFLILKKVEIEGAGASFLDALTKASDVNELMNVLSITAGDLEAAEAKLADLKAEETRRNGIIKVCGEDFDSAEENLVALWAFLKARIPDAALNKGRPLNLNRPPSLEELKAPRKREQGEAMSAKVTLPRQSKAMDELVGLAGEIFVFRMLQREYGSDVVTSSSWKSENSRRVFPQNEADDGLGYDFAFSSKGLRFLVEVKATKGTAEAFRLGSTEIEMAKRLKSVRSHRRERFLIVHVKQALSEMPEPVVLSNPYGQDSAGCFIIQEGDARVRYHLKG